MPYYIGNFVDGPYPFSYMGIDDVSLVTLSAPVPTPPGLVLVVRGISSPTMLRLSRRELRAIRSLGIAVAHTVRLTTNRTGLAERPGMPV